MSPHRWRRIQVLFSAVADLPSAEREAVLAREASGDAALRREVEALLSTEGDAALFFERLSDALLDAQHLPGARGRGTRDAAPEA